MPIRINDSLDRPNAGAAPPDAPLATRPAPRDDWRNIIARGVIYVLGGSVAWLVMPEWAHNYITAVGLGLGTIELGKRALTDTVMGIPVRTWFNRITATEIVGYAGRSQEFAAQAELPRGLQAYQSSAAPARQLAAGDTVDAQEVIEVDPFAAALDALPRLIDLEHVIDAQPSSFSVPLGQDHTGAPVWRDMRKDMLHVGIFGGTGAGKDNLFESWFVALTRQNTPDQVQFAVLDGKGHWTQPALASRAHFWRSPAGGIGQEGQDQMQALLKAIQQEAARRGKLVFGADCDTLERYMLKTGDKLPYLVVYFSDVMGNLVADVDRLLVDLVSKARALGIRVVVSLQTPTKQNTQWRANLSTVICGQLQGRSNDAPALGLAERDILFPPSQLPDPKLRPGVFSVRSGRDQLLIQAPLVRRDYMARVVSELPGRPALRAASAAQSMPNLRATLRASVAAPDPLLASLMAAPAKPQGLAQDRLKLYMRVMVQRGWTRKMIRAWTEQNGLHFDNDVLTTVRSELGLSAKDARK